MNQETTNDYVKEVTVKRKFDADRKTVFSMWTKPELFTQWYGPKGVTVSECRIELRPGGEYYALMNMPDGRSYPSTGVFKSIKEPEKIVFSLLANQNAKGEAQIEMLHTVTFTEEKGITTLTMHIEEIKTMEGVMPLRGLDRPWNQSFDKLTTVLKKR